MTERPLFHRTNLNLYTTDVEFMRRVFGRGWTEHARDIIHQELKAVKARIDYIRIAGTTPNDILNDIPWKKLP